MNKNPLDLNGLTMDDIDFSGAKEETEKLEQIFKEYQDKYGDKWWDHYIMDTDPDFKCHRDPKSDWYEETINEAIYNGHMLCVSGDPQIVHELHKKYQEKMKRLFGPFYKRYIHHNPNDSKVNKALLKDALKSGKWKDLPKELYEEYHKMAGK